MTGLLGDAFAHHIWATEQLIDACAALTEEQFTMPALGTYGSIYDTLRHLVKGDCWYLSFFREWSEPEEDAQMSLDQMRAMIGANGAAWTEVLAGDVDPDTDVVEHGDGWEYHAPVGVRLAQVIHHGTDHRSQICTALTSLGFTPPEIDVWGFGKAAGRTKPIYL